ncbi:helix-turn-helix transcriptional regulator [Nocardia sp. NPDC059177]|uniref:helix-turn-helix transcriptional regulator n=1 Tax=Nocardia sp. NPDC059177 TaxID=3346759 RepID=UPI003691B7B9
MPKRDELAAFLRTRRARLRPADVGLPDAGPRRTPGLRRQEVAQLAGISVDYYIRVEQARGAKPSRQVLAALARALMLTVDERDYLFRVTGESPPPVPGPDRVVPHAIHTVLDNLAAPAYVVDASFEVLVWNRAATAFIGDLATVEDHERNLVRWMFLMPTDDPAWDDPDTERYVRSTVAELRATYARYPGNPALAALVTELLGTAPRFAAMWADHDVAVRRTHRKHIRHPQLGPLEFECQELHIADTDQRLIVYCADAGSPTAEVFAALAAGVAGPPNVVRPGVNVQSKGAQSEY